MVGGPKAEELKGEAEEKLGEITGGEQWQAAGKAEQIKGNVKQVEDALSHGKDDSED